MSRHPAPEELLLDYAAGVLPEGPALAVSLHVALDPAARAAVERLAAVGGALLEAKRAAASGRSDEAALERRAGAARWHAGRAAGPAPSCRGRASTGRRRRWRRYLGARRAGSACFGGFEEIRIGLHGDSHRVSLLRLAAGHAACRCIAMSAPSTPWSCRAATPTRPATTASATSPSAPARSSTSRSPIRASPASP